MSESFFSRFGTTPTVSHGAPGRIALLGDTGESDGGSALSIATPQRVFVELAARQGKRVRVFSVETGAEEYELGSERRGRGWLDLVQGITHTLDERRLRGLGFDLFIHSEVPVGAGLASGAALEVAVLRGLRQLWGLALSDLEVALLAQRAENEFVGAHVGMMDQLAVSLGSAQTALLIDGATLEYRQVLLPSRVELLVIDSGLRHVRSVLRRKECEVAASELGVDSLSLLASRDLPRVLQLPEPLRRRARHVITEHERVEAAVLAIEEDDVDQLGRLINASHASLRDDFDASSPALEQLVALARAEKGVLGARLSGGGTGGSVAILSTTQDPRAQAEAIADRYARETGHVPRIVLPR